MSTVRKRTDTGYYYVNAVVNGKRKRISLDTKDKTAARIKAAVKLKEISCDTVIEKSTVYSLLELYREHSFSRNKGKTTLENEASIIRVFKSLVKDEPLERFDVMAADAFFQKLSTREDKTITGRGKNYYLRTLRMIWGVGLAWKMVGSNPFVGVKKFAVEDVHPRVWSEDEIIKIFQAIVNRFPNLVDIMLFYLLTGMRRNEALGLKWVEVDGKSIMISRAKQRKFRLVPLFRIPRELLDSRRALPAPFSDAPTGSTISHDFCDAVRDAGIPHAKLHDLRKTFGTMLARHNVNPYTIMQWLGHSNNDITMTHYIGMDTSTADRLDDVGAELAAKIRALKPEKK